jgi:hypothetical protein
MKTSIPPDELYAVRLREDASPVAPEDWNPAMERYLGTLWEFSPQHRYACPDCRGRGLDKHLISAGDWEWVDCATCRGTGVRLRRRG